MNDFLWFSDRNKRGPSSVWVETGKDMAKPLCSYSFCVLSIPATQKCTRIEVEILLSRIYISLTVAFSRGIIRSENNVSLLTNYF